MAKFIGTGKDPRFPEGHDYDVFEGDAQHHIDSKLGVPVEPGTEAYAIHRGYDTIAVDPGEQAAFAAGDQASHEPASRTASRVETTAGSGEEAQSAEAAVKEAEGNATEDEDADGAIATTDDMPGAKGGSKSGADKLGGSDASPDKAVEKGDKPGPSSLSDTKKKNS